MSSTTDLDQVLRAHFDLHADPTVLDGQLDRITDRAATVRQRPGWMTLERWLPMSAISARFWPAPRLPLRLAVLGLLVLALAAAALLVAGALRHPVPAPFGPARNGLIAYADSSGAINVGDPVTGLSNVLVAGPGKDRPLFSPDGTQIAFRSSEADGQHVIVVGADGSGARKITTDPLISITYLAWSPDSRSVVVGHGSDELDLFSATGAARPTKLAAGVAVGAGDYNAQPAHLYRPPDGRNVLYLRIASSHPAMIIADADGTDERALIDADRPGVPFIYLGSPQWSPDGSMITFVGATRDVAEDYVAYVMNADGTGLRKLSTSTHPIDDSNPAWSPDGTSIAVQRWNVDPGANQQEARPITVIDVKSGRELEVGVPPVSNGFDAWGWSPDGASILELAPGQNLVIANVATRATRPIPWQISSGPNWQRMAP